MFSLGLLKVDECNIIPLGESGPSLDDSIQTISQNKHQGVATKLRTIPFLHRITNLQPLFDILETCYKEIHKIYYLKNFSFFTQVWFPETS